MFFKRNTHCSRNNNFIFSRFLSFCARNLLDFRPNSVGYAVRELQEFQLLHYNSITNGQNINSHTCWSSHFMQFLLDLLIDYSCGSCKSTKFTGAASRTRQCVQRQAVHYACVWRTAQRAYRYATKRSWRDAPSKAPRGCAGS